MAKSVVEGKTSDFWSEVKRIKGCKSTVTASVDGEVDDGCIADLFANKYKTLYNSVSYDPSELRKIHDTVDAIILDKSETSLITIDDVRISIASLKPGKADGRSGVLTDHMHGGHNLHVYLCQLDGSTSQLFSAICVTRLGNVVYVSGFVAHLSRSFWQVFCSALLFSATARPRHSDKLTLTRDAPPVSL